MIFTQQQSISGCTKVTAESHQPALYKYNLFYNFIFQSSFFFILIDFIIVQGKPTRA